jgi:hypothetical protein
MLSGIAPDDRLRGDLRVLAIVHDAFKAEVRAHERWSPDNDHAMIARRFADGYIADERLLTTLELHDEPYWIWRNAGATEGALQPLLARLRDIELFPRFVELDAANEGKDLTFLRGAPRSAAGGQPVIRSARARSSRSSARGLGVRRRSGRGGSGTRVGLSGRSRAGPRLRPPASGRP